MKSLRRSFQSKDHVPTISTPIPAVSKPTTSIVPPKKVIRALSDHRPQAPHELSFAKGDFFHVINELNQGEGWYEATNPMTGARGLVPKRKFEEFSKDAARASKVAPSLSTPPLSAVPKKTPITSPKHVYYAIVQHDFVAERADELDAKSGDHISIVAQSNYEWFVAKPISKLGRPGLIPVSFVALHDPAMGRALSEDEIRALMEKGNIPGVDEWKKSIMEYKAASISLGVIDDDNTKGPVPNSPFMPQSPSTSKSPSFPPPPSVPASESILPPGILLSAEVVSWHFEMDEYWFRVHALYQPDDPSGSNKLPPAKSLVLYRVYNDFYDFQVELLNSFPVEAGRTEDSDGQVTEGKRILPYMPGPAAQVDDKLTNVRREELDVYLNQFCGLWEFDAERILRHKLVRQFFTPKVGDMDDDVEPATHKFEERYGPDWQRKAVNRQSRDKVAPLQQSFSRLSARDQEQGRGSDGSQYDDDEQPPGYESHAPYNGRLTEKGSDRTSRHSESSKSQHRKSASRSSQADRERSVGRPDSRARSPFTATSARPQSPHHTHSHSHSYSLSTQTHLQADRTTSPVPRITPAGRALAKLDTSHNGRRHDDDSPRTTPSVSSPPLLSRTTSAASAGTHASFNTPPISSSNPATAFIKIKIFDRVTQELIAIRVNPRVTHAQLMEKVQSRLGNDVQHLRYRDSRLSEEFFELIDDQDLKRWLEGSEKHVLYAE